MLSLIKEKDDVIFVSDTRLNTDIQKSALNNLEKKLLFGGYDCFFNSETSNRGTGILIKNKLNYTIISKECDIGGNFILLKLKIENKPLIIGSIYGPNINENIGVYEELTNKLSGLECETIVLGGNWNCTVDCQGTDSNLDVLNMVSIPSKIRSEKVKKICEKFKLVDPFRTLHPTKLEFTYIPAIIANTNRSRLDFFLVSESVFGNVSKCGTTNSLTCTSFDHKPVNLSFKKIKNIGKIKQVQNSNLKDPNLKMAVETAAIECYLHHVTRTDILNEIFIDSKLLIIGNIMRNIDRINNFNNEREEGGGGK